MIKAVTSFSSISVDSLEKAREFYVDTLELSIKNEDMGLTVELPGGGSLFIYEKLDHEPATFTVLNFVVEDISDTVDHLVVDHGIVFERYDFMPGEQDEKGIMRSTAPEDGPDIAWFKDPSGNVISVIQKR